jgi:hypothetical protein
MQLEKASVCEVTGPPALDEPPEPVDGRTLVVVVGPSCASWLPGEPPHDAASRAKPATPMIAAAMRALRDDGVRSRRRPHERSAIGFTPAMVAPSRLQRQEMAMNS